MPHPRLAGAQGMRPTQGRPISRRKGGRNVDQVLCRGDGLLVERKRSGPQAHRHIELRVSESTVDVAIELGEIARNIACPSSTSSARPRPRRRGSRALGPPPGTRPAPTSHCDKMAFSRLAKRISLASDSSLPTPVARPRIAAIDTTGARLRRASRSGKRLQARSAGGKLVVSLRASREKS